MKVSSTNQKTQGRYAMPNIEIHDRDMRVATAMQTALRKHLHRCSIGKDCMVTIVEARCMEVLASS